MGSSLSGDLKKARGNAELLERVAASLGEYPHPSEKEMAMALQYAIEARSAAAAKAFANRYPGSDSVLRVDYRVAIEAVRSANPAAAVAVAAAFAPSAWLGSEYDRVGDIVAAIVNSAEADRLLATIVMVRCSYWGRTCGA